MIAGNFVHQVLAGRVWRAMAYTRTLSAPPCARRDCFFALVVAARVGKNDHPQTDTRLSPIDPDIPSTGHWARAYEQGLPPLAMLARVRNSCPAWLQRMAKDRRLRQ